MTTEERLEVLEKEVKRVRRHNRWLLGVILFAGTGLSLVSLLGMRTAQVPDEIRARRFVLEGEDGNVRANLLTQQNGSVALNLCDSSSTSRLMLLAPYHDEDSLGPGVFLAKGGQRVWLVMRNDATMLTINPGDLGQIVLSSKDEDADLLLGPTWGDEGRVHLSYTENGPLLHLDGGAHGGGKHLFLGPGGMLPLPPK